jgi:hypothetical protein
MRFRFLYCPVMVMASEWMPLHCNDSSMTEIRSFEQNQIDAILADAAQSLAEDRPDEAMRLLDKHQARLAKTAATECRAAVLASRSRTHRRNGGQAARRGGGAARRVV